MSGFTEEHIDERNFDVRFIENKNRAVFTTKLIKKGSTVIEYIGDVITSKEEIHKREICYSENNLGCYILDFMFNGKKAYIDATKESPCKARLINHSTSPNLVPFLRVVNGVPRVFFRAKYNIQPNTELVWDYGDRRRAVMECNPWLKPAKQSRGIYFLNF